MNALLRFLVLGGATVAMLSVLNVPTDASSEGVKYTSRTSRFSDLSRGNSVKYTKRAKRFSSISGYKYRSGLNKGRRISRIGKRDYRIPR
ncbi:MAG: hypothetical protein AAF501_00705 [Pseudomonadota bacterium]